MSQSHFASRLSKVGLLVAVSGLLFTAVGGFTLVKTQEGATSLQKYSAAQAVNLSYNDQGQLTDHGTVDGANAIKNLLVNEWGFKIVDSDLNPADPLVNTATEYMYQLATVTEHTLTATTTVHLDAPVDYKGTTYPAGDNTFINTGKFYAQFDRSNPIEGPARDKIWTPTALGIVAALGVGTVTASALQMGYGIAGMAAGLGAVLIFFGLGLVWATRPIKNEVEAVRAA